MTIWAKVKGKTSKALLFALLWFIYSLSFADSLKVSVLLSSDSPIYYSVSEHIRTATTAEVTFKQLALGSPESLPSSNSELILTVGSRAFEHALKQYAHLPIIASFLPRRVYEQLISTHQNNAQRTAVFIDQSMKNQLSLAKLILPEAKTIGTVFGKSSINEQARLSQAADSLGLTINAIALNEEDNPVNILQPIIENSDLFLAIPDQSAFNRASAKWSLYLSLRAQKPLLGFSEKYVDAGALASIYSTPEQIGRQTADFIDSYTQTNKLKESEHPKHFTIKTNLSSAKIINPDLPNTQTLTEQLRRMP